VKWFYETKQLQYAEVIENKYLTLGYADKSLSIPLGEAFIVERIRQKIEKIMKAIK
jgi:hypothetical protein